MQHRTAVTKSEVFNESLGAQRNALLARLKNSGQLLVTSKTMNEFSQMSVRECRAFVTGVEKLIRALPNARPFEY